MLVCCDGHVRCGRNERTMLGLVGYIAAILTTVSAVPQLIHTLRTRDTRGISIPSWLTLSAGVALWLVYGIRCGSGPLILGNAISLSLDVAVLSLALSIRAKRISAQSSANIT
jgi:MtN3 and saliva related transmembrane protein